jgi:zinc transporter 1/2/3
MVSATGILLLTVVSALAPLHLGGGEGPGGEAREGFKERLLAHFTFFTGGVFLGAGLLHMLPDAVETYALAMTGSDATYPVPYLCACFGFLLVWGVDRILTVLQVPQAHVVAAAAGAQQRGGDANICFVNIAPVTTYGSAESKNPPPPAHPTYSSFGEHGHAVESNHQHTESNRHGHGHDTVKHSVDSSMDCNSASRKSASSYGMYGDDGCSRGSHKDYTHADGNDHQHDEHSHLDVHHHHFIVPGNGSLFIPLVLTIVLSIHSFLAGLALGVQTKLDAAGVSILVAILAHKVVEALAVGAGFAKENVDVRKASPIILVYCFMTPMGITSGMVLTSLFQGQTSLLFQALLSATAAGSFLYLALHEISTGSCHVKPGVTVLLFACGVICMALLAIWV